MDHRQNHNKCEDTRNSDHVGWAVDFKTGTRINPNRLIMQYHDIIPQSKRSRIRVREAERLGKLRIIERGESDIRMESPQGLNDP